MTAVCFNPDSLFRLATNCNGDTDFTQAPMKLSFLLFCIEVFVCMLFFPRAAMSFASRHISRSAVRRMSTGILIFNIGVFWTSWLTVFCFIFFGTDEVGVTAKRFQRFPTDMYSMHKVWTGHWIDDQAFRVAYSIALFVAFAVYIVSVSRLTVSFRV